MAFTLCGWRKTLILSRNLITIVEKLCRKKSTNCSITDYEKTVCSASVRTMKMGATDFLCASSGDSESSPCVCFSVRTRNITSLSRFCVCVVFFNFLLLLYSVAPMHAESLRALKQKCVLAQESRVHSTVSCLYHNNVGKETNINGEHDFIYTTPGHYAAAVL